MQVALDFWGLALLMVFAAYLLAGFIAWVKRLLG